MKIIINDRRKISSLQKEFNEVFPFLKLEFFSKSHLPGEATPKKQLKDPAKSLGDCRTIHNKGVLVITPQMTVSELEEKFRNIFGLAVQIFRSSGKVWLETTVTDGWSLEEQNKQGEELSRSGSIR